MKRFLFLMVIFLNVFDIRAFESAQKMREIIFLWEEGKREEALKSAENSSFSEKEEFSYALYLFSLDLYKRGEISYAKRFVKIALDLNPDMGRGWSALSFFELKRGNIHLFIKYLSKAFNSFLKDFKNQVIFLSVLLKSFFISVLLSFFFLSVLFLLKYLPLVRDDLSRILGDISLKSSKIFSFVLLLIIPAVFFMGWALSAIIWTAFVWSFLKNKEKRLVVVSILLIFLGIIGNKISSSLIEEISRNGLKSKFFTLFDAKKYIEKGELEKAIKILNEVNNQSPNLYSLVTLGNIKLKEGKYDESKGLYEKALMLYPKSNIPYSNLSILFETIGETQYAERYKEKAKALKGKGEGLIWPELNSLYGWKIILKENLNSKNILSPDLFFVFITILIGILINLILKFSPLLYGESRFCLSCGKSINIHFDLKITNPDYCEECYKLFVWKPPELEIVRASKAREIKRKRLKEMNIYRIFNMLVPFSALIRYEKSSMGYIGLTIFVFLLSSAFFLKETEPFSIPFAFVLFSIIFYLISIFIFDKKVREEWKEL